MNDQKPSQTVYSLPGVMRYLQTEWQRNEHDRIQWELERAEMKTKIARLEGEKRGLQLVVENCTKKIRLLESSLDTRGSDVYQQAKEEFNDSVNKELLENENLDLTPLIDSRKYLEKCIQDVSYLLQSTSMLYPDGSISTDTRPNDTRPNDTDLQEGSDARPAFSTASIPALSEKPRTDAERRPVSSKTFSLNLRHTVKYTNPCALEFIDADHFLVGNDEGTINLYSTASKPGAIALAPTSVRTISAHKGIVTSIVYDKNLHLYTAGSDGYIRVWDVNAPAHVLSLSIEMYAHHDTIHQLAYHESRQLLASISEDKTVKVWTKSFDKLKQIPITMSDGVQGTLLSIAFSKSGDRLYVGCSNNTILQIDIEMGVVAYQFDVGPSEKIAVNALCCSNTLIAALSNGDIAHFDINSGIPLHREKFSQQSQSPVTALTLCPGNEDIIASGNEDGILRLNKNMEPIEILGRYTGPGGVKGINWFSDKLLAAFGGDSTIRIYYG